MSERFVLAIDVGGTKTAFARVAMPGGQIVERRLIATPSGSAAGRDFLDEVEAIAQTLVTGADGDRCVAIGLGICELVDPSGAVRSGHRVRWQGLPVCERLSRLAPAFIESDVHAAAHAEARLGAGRPYAQFLYLNIGTGISTAWVVDGRVHVGAHGHALVLASSRWTTRCPCCGATSDCILEDVAGGAGLASRYRALTGRPVEAGRDVVAAARSGDPEALEVVRTAAESLGSALAMILGVLDPEALVIGGGLGAASGPYRDALVGATRDRIWSASTRDLPILPAELGSDAGLLGAALAAMQGSARP